MTTDDELHEKRLIEEPVGVEPPPRLIEEKVDRALRNIKRLTVAGIALIAIAIGAYLGSAYSRAQSNAQVLRTLQVNSGPKAAAVNEAYLAFIRFEIDCDGRYREQEGDNAVLSRLNQIVPQFSPPPIDLASNSPSCQAIPGAIKKLAAAQDALVKERERIK